MGEGNSSLQQGLFALLLL